MSETQTESETEHKTDAEPTVFASAPWEPEGPDQNGHAHVWGSDGDLVATVCDNPVYGETAYDRARLMAASGTAAQEAKEMGYDPQKTVEALPEGLEAAHKAIIDLQEAHTSGPPEDSAEAAAQAASHRLKVFMAEAGADESMIPGDASVALNSAEGSDHE
jgi:hypothetical protein